MEKAENKVAHASSVFHITNPPLNSTQAFTCSEHYILLLSFLLCIGFVLLGILKGAYK